MDEHTYHRYSLSEAEHVAARLELATGKPHVVTKVGRSRYQIRPGRLVSAMSMSHSHVLQEYPDGASVIAR